MLLQNLADMRGNHGAGINHGIAQALRFISHGGFNPNGIQPKGWVFSGRTL